MFMYRVGRTILGLAFVGTLFHWVGEGHDLQQALFPFLFIVGVLTTWVAGRPLGWAVSAIYMLIQGWGGLLLSDLRLDHGQDFFLWSRGQQETVVLTAIFSAFLLIAGLSGRLLGAIGSRLVARVVKDF